MPVMDIGHMIMGMDDFIMFVEMAVVNWPLFFNMQVIMMIIVMEVSMLVYQAFVFVGMFMFFAQQDCRTEPHERQGEPESGWWKSFVYRQR